MPSGRSLGIYEEHETTEEERRRRQRQEEQAGVERVDEFGMHLKAVQVGAGAARRPAWCLIAPRADLPGGTAGSFTCGQWVGCTAPMHTHPTRARARALACTHTSVPSWCAHLAPPPSHPASYPPHPPGRPPPPPFPAQSKSSRNFLSHIKL